MKNEKRALVISGGGKPSRARGKLAFLSKEILFHLYWEQEKSFSEIANMFHVTRTAISHKAKIFDIPSRTNKEASVLANSGERNPAKRPEVRAKLSGKNNHFYGKKHTDASRKKMSDSQKKWDRKHWTDIRWTKERREEMSKNNPMFKEHIKKKHLTNLRKNRHKFSGCNSPRWKGGITILNKKIRQLSEYKSWRSEVYTHNGYICQICNTTSGSFNIDHIKAFSILLRDNNITSIKQAIECSDLWDCSNGRVLCVECHRQTDNFGGKA